MIGKECSCSTDGDGPPVLNTGAPPCMPLSTVGSDDVRQSQLLSDLVERCAKRSARALAAREAAMREAADWADDTNGAALERQWATAREAAAAHDKARLDEVHARNALRDLRASFGDRPRALPPTTSLNEDPKLVNNEDPPTTSSSDDLELAGNEMLYLLGKQTPPSPALPATPPPPNVAMLPPTPAPSPPDVLIPIRTQGGVG